MESSLLVPGQKLAPAGLSKSLLLVDENQSAANGSGFNFCRLLNAVRGRV